MGRLGWTNTFQPTPARAICLPRSSWLLQRSFEPHMKLTLGADDPCTRYVRGEVPSQHSSHCAVDPQGRTRHSAVNVRAPLTRFAGRQTGRPMSPRNLRSLRPMLLRRSATPSSAAVAQPYPAVAPALSYIPTSTENLQPAQYSRVRKPRLRTMPQTTASGAQLPYAQAEDRPCEASCPRQKLR